ncbi:hypothetical protein HS7_21150 [Sulfolobales archaeon HS-7]|nr:hypothetical protein HS7_21150 [Sulfolobales archaeon HS-7]
MKYKCHGSFIDTDLTFIENGLQFSFKWNQGRTGKGFIERSYSETVYKLTINKQLSDEAKEELLNFFKLNFIKILVKIKQRQKSPVIFKYIVYNFARVNDERLWGLSRTITNVEKCTRFSPTNNYECITLSTNSVIKSTYKLIKKFEEAENSRTKMCVKLE